ncbi:MAG: winged helix-turn-helix domain-containing protein [Dokdonella sp.]
MARPNLLLRIGEQVVDVGALRVVTRPDLPRLTSKAVAVLIELVRHAGSTVTRDQLFDRVWTGRFTTPDVLTQAIKELRRAFADDSKPPLYIETIPKVGYRLIARVLVLEAQDGGLFLERTAVQSINDDEGPGDEAAAVRPDATQTMPPMRTRRTWRVGALLAVAGVLAVGAIAWLAHYSARAPLSAAVAAPKWQASDVRALTSDPGAERRPRLSPDGTRVAFGVLDEKTGFDRIVVRSIEPSQLVHITIGANEHEALPAWSPDGMRIVYERLRGSGCAMYVASSLGGGEHEVGTCPDYLVNYYDWTPDGTGVLTAERALDGSRELALTRLDLATGTKQLLNYQRDAQDQDLEPRYSPDGHRIAFRRGISPYSDLYVMDASGGPVRQVTRLSARIRGFTWTRDGRGLVFASNHAGPMALYALDIESGHVQALGVSPAEAPDAARGSDALVYEIPRTHSGLARLALDAGASPARLLAPSTGNDYSPMLSPSADRVVFVSDRSGQYQLWLYDEASDKARPLTNRADTAFTSPRWRSDGNAVLAIERGADHRKLVEIDLATLRQRVISRPDENVLLGDYGIDADSYLLVAGISGRDNELMQVEHAGQPGERHTTLLKSVAEFELDPSSRSIYYTPTAQSGLFRFDLDTAVTQLVSPKITSVSANWHLVDGRIWYIGDIEVMSANLHELDPASGADRVISPLKALMRDLHFSVMPDRKAIVAVPFGAEDTDIGMLQLTRTDANAAALP